MSFSSRNGERVSRSFRTNRRKPELGYYLIVTNAKGTEHVYFEGFYERIKNLCDNRIVIKVVDTTYDKMIIEAKRISSELTQYVEPWIVFDKDEVNNFDKKIKEAENEGIRVARSNPCIEIWFFAYFGRIPHLFDSVTCCKQFEAEFQKKTTHDYYKNDQKLYNRLFKNGDEQNAISIAKRKMNDHIKRNNGAPSSQVPGTKVHELIGEILSKIS